jgi:hypothetical protein
MTAGGLGSSTTFSDARPALVGTVADRLQLDVVRIERERT